MFTPYYVYPYVAFPDFMEHGWLGDDPSLLGRSFFQVRVRTASFREGNSCRSCSVTGCLKHAKYLPLRSPILPLQNWSQVGSGWSCGREMAKNSLAAKTGGL